MAQTGLSQVEALAFDIFGTVVDWESSVTSLLTNKAEKGDSELLSKIDWLTFTREWRKGYQRRTKEIAGGADGPTHIDDLHRELLDSLLTRDDYATVAQAWGDDDRKEAVQFWHKLDAWPDSGPGLQSLRDAGKLTTTLSNGSTRLLVDLARHSSPPLAFDLILSGSLVGAYKPDPKTYLGACAAFDLPPDKVAMVAAHLHDLEAASKHGLRTIYVLRETEDKTPGLKEGIKLRSQGGFVDAIVRGIDEIPALLA